MKGGLALLLLFIAVFAREAVGMVSPLYPSPLSAVAGVPIYIQQYIPVAGDYCVFSSLRSAINFTDYSCNLPAGLQLGMVPFKILAANGTTVAGPVDVAVRYSRSSYLCSGSSSGSAAGYSARPSASWTYAATGGGTCPNNNMYLQTTAAIAAQDIGVNVSVIVSKPGTYMAIWRVMSLAAANPGFTTSVFTPTSCATALTQPQVWPGGLYQPYAANSNRKFSNILAGTVKVLSPSCTITVRLYSTATGTFSASTFAIGYMYLSGMPSVLSVSPSTGPTVGGYAVTVTGVDLGIGNDITSARIGGLPAPIRSVSYGNALSNNTIVLTVPQVTSGSLNVTFNSSFLGISSFSGLLSLSSTDGIGLGFSPSTVGYAGASLFNMTGVGFTAPASPDLAFCRFNRNPDLVVPAMFIDSTTVQCLPATTWIPESSRLLTPYMTVEYTQNNKTTWSTIQNNVFLRLTFSEPVSFGTYTGYVPNGATREFVLTVDGPIDSSQALSVSVFMTSGNADLGIVKDGITSWSSGAAGTDPENIYITTNDVENINGTYVITVIGAVDTDFSLFTQVVATQPTLSNGVATFASVKEDLFRVFSFVVDDTPSKLVVSVGIEPEEGDVDLCVTSDPTITTYGDCPSIYKFESSGSDVAVIDSPTPGTWTIFVLGFTVPEVGGAASFWVTATGLPAASDTFSYTAQDGSIILGQVDTSATRALFAFELTSPGAAISVTLTVDSGFDADLYASNTSAVSKTNYLWNSESVGSDDLYIAPDDTGYPTTFPATMYFLVSYYTGEIVPFTIKFETLSTTETLVAGSPVSGAVSQSNPRLFVFEHTTDEDLMISVQAVSGVLAVYVSTDAMTTTPSSAMFTWSSDGPAFTKAQSGFIYIPKDDDRFVSPGNYYINIECVSSEESAFMLVVFTPSTTVTIPQGGVVFGKVLTRANQFFEFYPQTYGDIVFSVTPNGLGDPDLYASNGIGNWTAMSSGADIISISKTDPQYSDTAAYVIGVIGNTESIYAFHAYVEPEILPLEDGVTIDTAVGVSEFQYASYNLTGVSTFVVSVVNNSGVALAYFSTSVQTPNTTNGGVTFRTSSESQLFIFNTNNDALFARNQGFLYIGLMGVEPGPESPDVELSVVAYQTSTVVQLESESPVMGQIVGPGYFRFSFIPTDMDLDNLFVLSNVSSVLGSAGQKPMLIVSSTLMQPTISDLTAAGVWSVNQSPGVVTITSDYPHASSNYYGSVYCATTCSFMVDVTTKLVQPSAQESYVSVPQYALQNGNFTITIYARDDEGIPLLTKYSMIFTQVQYIDDVETVFLTTTFFGNETTSMGDGVLTKTISLAGISASTITVTSSVVDRNGMNTFTSGSVSASVTPGFSLVIPAGVDYFVRRNQPVAITTQLTYLALPDNYPLVSQWIQTSGPQIPATAAFQRRDLALPAFFLPMVAEVNVFTFDLLVYPVGLPQNVVIQPVTVTLTAQPLVVGISGPSFIYALTSSRTALTIDASNSRATYDPDNLNVTSSFTWSCTLQGQTNDVCSSVAANTASISTSKLLVNPQALTPGQNYTFTVTYAKTFRSKTASVTVAASIDTPPPQIGIIPIANKVNANQRVVIAAAMVDPTRPYTYSWTETTGLLNLATAASGGTTNLNLVLRPNVLTPLASYSFTVTARDALGRTGSSSITITVNAPPSGGSCSVSPSNGTAFQTLFTLSCGGWSDPDSPLTYQLSYVTSVGSEIVISSYSSGLSAASTTLPQGNAVGNLTLVGYVSDALGAITRVPFFANVTLPKFDNSSAQLAFTANQVQNALAQTSDAQSLVTAVSSVASLLNAPVQNADAAQIQQRTELRTSVINALSSNLLSDASVLSEPALISSTAGTLLQLTASTSEIVPDAQVNAASVISATLSAAISAAPDLASAEPLDTAVAITIGKTLSNLAESSLTTSARASDVMGKVTTGVDLLSDALLLGAVPGEEAVVISTPTVTLVSQRNAAPLDGESTPYSPAPGFEIDLGVVQTSSSFIDMKVAEYNIDPYFYSPASKNVTSGVTSIWLQDDLGDVIPVDNLPQTAPIVFVIPYNASLVVNGSLPTCKFWSAANQAWNSSGCFTFNVTSTNVTCHCYHLTDFSVVAEMFIPPMNLLEASDFENLDEKILQNPFGIAVICAMLGFEMILMFFAYRVDNPESPLATCNWKKQKQEPMEIPLQEMQKQTEEPHKQQPVPFIDDGSVAISLHQEEEEPQVEPSFAENTEQQQEIKALASFLNEVTDQVLLEEKPITVYMDVDSDDSDHILVLLVSTEEDLKSRIPPEQFAEAVRPSEMIVGAVETATSPTAPSHEETLAPAELTTPAHELEVTVQGKPAQEKLTPEQVKARAKAIASKFRGKASTGFKRASKRLWPNMKESHQWLQIVFGDPEETFSRTQLLAILFSTLLAAMLGNALFVGQDAPTAAQSVAAGIITSLISAPIGYVIVALFSKTMTLNALAREEEKIAEIASLKKRRTLVRYGELAASEVDMPTKKPLLLKDTGRRTLLPTQIGFVCLSIVAFVLAFVTGFEGPERLPFDATQDLDLRLALSLFTMGMFILAYVLTYFMWARGRKAVKAGKSPFQDAEDRNAFMYGNLVLACAIGIDSLFIDENFGTEEDPDVFALFGSIAGVLATCGIVYKLIGLSFTIRDKYEEDKEYNEQIDRGEDPDLEYTPANRPLPAWCEWIAWLVCAGYQTAAGFIIVVYGLKFEQSQTQTFIISTIVSAVQEGAITEPLKGISKTFIGSFMAGFLVDESALEEMTAVVEENELIEEAISAAIDEIFGGEEDEE